MTPEKYARYKQLSRAGVEKMVKLGMAFTDIVEKEKRLNMALEVTEAEISEQYDALVAQARQKREPPPDARRAR